LFPADVVGTMIYNIKQNEFLLKSNLFSPILSVINRAPAKVQSGIIRGDGGKNK
jgi:MoxR-like ATPase